MIIDTEKDSVVWVIFGEDGKAMDCGWNGLGGGGLDPGSHLSSAVAGLIKAIMDKSVNEEVPSARTLNEVWVRIGNVLSRYLDPELTCPQCVEENKETPLKLIP